MATKPISPNSPRESSDHQSQSTERIATPDLGINTADILGENLEMGNIAENASEGRERKSDNASQAKKTQQTDPAAIRAQLLAKAPKPQLMAREVEKQLKKEINHLHGRILKMVILPGPVDYNEMNNIVKKIRKLREILKSLLKLSLDSLKTLWLRFVHGVI